MFDVTPEDIASLPDDVLRELVARLAAAELERHGQAVHAVTAGGHQDAPDGGIDVRVSLAPGSFAGPNLPRADIGYQVKRPDMARNTILREMRPGGEMRPVIAELMAAGGAYIIVSSQGSTADRPLRERRAAMREALDGYPAADQLHTDFYDRTRVANWARQHPGIVLWVREQVGRSLAGWRPYGNWSNRDETAEVSYLVDGRIRVRFNREEQGVAAAEAIERLRAMILTPGAAVRLVGLSGVGKTRLVQALFDPTIGNDSLPQAAAVYTDFHERTTPQPEGMAEDLIAQRRHAILIIDNCSSATHARLAAMCKERDCTISLLTVEYDVREDVPESTQVVAMGTASESLIEELLRRRYPRLSSENAVTIAHVSGGNARIALAIADTVHEGEELTGLRAGEIFDRLFHQRHAHDDGLLRAAEAFALVYSFDGDTEEGDLAELPVLAQLAQMGLDELYRHLQTLRARDLVQSRSSWRAILPHALANHLASNALIKIRPTKLRRILIESGHERLFFSFCHRLSYLHDSPAAVAWCEEFLRSGGVIGQLLAYTPQQHQLLAYLAPVAPGSALAAIERAANLDADAWLEAARHHIEVLHQLAWDASYFDRAVVLLIRIVRANRHRIERERPQQILVSFFQPNRSGTHAPVSRRFELISEWLADPDQPVRNLGRFALSKAISARINGHMNFNFGARDRDSGWHPKTAEALADWFRSCQALLTNLYDAAGPHADFAKQTLAKNFRALWGFPLLHDCLMQQMKAFANSAFWREGWLAVRAAQQFRGEDPVGLIPLQQLEADLAPIDLPARILGTVLYGDGVFEGKQHGEDLEAYRERLNVLVHTLAGEAASDPASLRAVAKQLMTRPGMTEEFGCGLAQVDGAQQLVWDILVPVLLSVMEENGAFTPPRRTVPHVLRGYVHELVGRDRPLVERYLDQCANNALLAPVLPTLQAAAGFDQVGFNRVVRAYIAGLVPVGELFWVRTAALAPIAVQQAALEFLEQVAGQPGGVQSVIESLHVWLNQAEQPGSIAAPGLVATCQRVLENLAFAENDSENAYYVTRIAKVAIRGERAAALAASIAARMGLAAQTVYSLSSDYEDLVLLLLAREPEAVLSALCQENPQLLSAAAELLGQESREGKYPLGEVEPKRLAAWCAVDSGLRLPLMLRVIPAVENDPVTGQARLTGHATALLLHSPTPEATLQELVERMELQSMRNGRGASITQNAGALDEVLDWHDVSFQAFARAEKERMLADGAYQLARETVRDRLRNERFE